VVLFVGIVGGSAAAAIVRLFVVRQSYFLVVIPAGVVGRLTVEWDAAVAGVHTAVSWLSDGAIAVVRRIVVIVAAVAGVHTTASHSSDGAVAVVRCVVVVIIVAAVAGVHATASCLSDGAVVRHAVVVVAVAGVHTAVSWLSELLFVVSW